MLAKLETIEQFANAISLMRLGTAALQLALALTLVVGALSVLAMVRKDERLAHAARRGQYAMLLVTAFCCVLLYTGIFDGYYFVRYIRHVTENNETTGFKVAALWASQQGSLLFWCFIMTLFGGVFAFTQRHNRTDRRLPATLLVLSVVQFFFFFIMVAPFEPEAAQRSSPFALEYHWMLTEAWASVTAGDVVRQITAGAQYTGSQDVLNLIYAMQQGELETVRFAQLYTTVTSDPASLPVGVQQALLDGVSDGNGMNPALHNYWIAIHPPMLYLGFVGFTVPFAYAVGSLISGDVGEGWLRPIRLWTMGAWGFLTVGIALGGLWAYEILGWGGYWAWDPVENASFVPWLTGTAFIHSIIVTERRGLLRVWAFGLIIITYCMTVIGTFLVRSGVIPSVHAFGATGDVDTWFYGFIAVVFVGSLLVLIWRLPLLKSDRRLESLFSREGSFLFNNLIFLAIALVTQVITFWPWITKQLYGEGGVVEFGQDQFVMINAPLFLIILILMGVGPALAWRETTWRAAARAFAIPVVLALLAGIVNWWWLSGAGLLKEIDQPDPSASRASFVRLMIQLTLWPICVFTFVCIVQEFISGARARARNTRERLLPAIAKLTLANRRRYGGYIVHLGILLIALGIYYSSLYEAEGTVVTPPGGFAIIENPLTGRQHVAYYAAHQRSESWDFLKDAFGRDEQRAQLYENMLREVRRNPDLDAQQLVAKIQADMTTSFEGELPPGLQAALPRMIAAIHWGVRQRQSQSVFESFDSDLYVFEYTQPTEVASGAYDTLHNEMLAALNRKPASGEDPRFAQLMAELFQDGLRRDADLRQLLSDAESTIGKATDEEFASESNLQGDATAIALARQTGLGRVRALQDALDRAVDAAIALGTELPQVHRRLRNDIAGVDEAAYARLFETVESRFMALQLLEHFQGAIEAEAARTRSRRVVELASQLPATQAQLEAMRPLSLAGLLQARQNVTGDAASLVEAEITAITRSALLMQPGMRIFYDKRTGAPRMNEPIKDPFYRRNLTRDLYFILQDAKPDGTATLRFFIKPHMTLGLSGLLVLIAGTVLAFLPTFRKRRVT